MANIAGCGAQPLTGVPTVWKYHGQVAAATSASDFLLVKSEQESSLPCGAMVVSAAMLSTCKSCLVLSLLDQAHTLHAQPPEELWH